MKQDNLPARRVKADLDLFREADSNPAIRSLKAGLLCDMCVNRVSMALKSQPPDKWTGTEANKWAGAARILRDLEVELAPSGRGTESKIRDITSEMGRILGGNKSKRKHGKTQPPPRQGVTDA